MMGRFSYSYPCALALATLMGCATHGSDDGTSDTEARGTLSLPLVTHGPSGTTYRLRNAKFEIEPIGYYFEGGRPNSILVNGDDDPDQESIQVNLEQGRYFVRLQPDWILERSQNGETTPIEAQLLNGSTQRVSVWPRSTSWVAYQFGVGDRALWFNGDVNIEAEVYEDPEDYYGSADGGWDGTFSTEDGG